MTIATDYPARRVANYALFVLLLAHVVAFLDRQILALLIEPIKNELGVSDTQLGLLHGFAFAIFYTLLGLPLGRLADRTVRKRLIAAGIFFWSVMTAACGLVRNFPQLVFARIGVAVGEASLLPSSYSIIADIFPPAARSRAISFFALGPFVGAGIAFLVGGIVVRSVTASAGFELPLVGEMSPWRLVFLVVALPGIIVTLMVLGLREPRRRETLGGDGPARLSIRFAISYIWANRRTYANVYFGFALGALMTFAFFAWIPTMLIRLHGMSIPQAGYTFGAMLLVFGATGTYVGGLLADRIAASGRSDAHLLVGIAAMSCMMLGGTVTPLISHTPTMLVLLAVTLFVHGLPVGMAPTALQSITPNELRGQINALYNLTVSIVGIGMGPLLVALFTDYVFGDSNAVGRSLAAVSLLAGPASAIVLMRGRKPFRNRYREWSQAGSQGDLPGS